MIGFGNPTASAKCPRQRLTLTNCRRDMIGCALDYAGWLCTVSARTSRQQGSFLLSQHICPAHLRLPPSFLHPPTSELRKRTEELYRHRTDAAMLWFKKREGDIEMEAMRGQKRDTTPEDTEYRSINWKKIMLSPKYIRKTSLSRRSSSFSC
jgi:hypothetical protein